MHPLRPKSPNTAPRFHAEELPWLWIPATTLLLLGAFGLRLFGLHRADLSFDEVATVFVARRPLGEVVRYVMTAAREHPPFYYLIMSTWFRWLGTSEFAVRFPSVLTGVLAVSWSFKLGRRLLGKSSGWWAAVLCAVAPFSVWTGRNGRMYGLVLLLSLVIIERWLWWARNPGWQNWAIFTVASLIGVMTHYYLVLLWAVEAILLVALPRDTRKIRIPWIATTAGLGLIFGLFVAISPGIRAMALEVAGRFPAWGFRKEELSMLVTDLYLWGYQPELVRVGLIGVGLTAIGWLIAWFRRPRAGAVLAAWGLVPLALLLLVPEQLASRYVALIFPAIALGMASLLSILRLRWIQVAEAGALLWLAVWRLPVQYANPDVSFSSRMATLHAAARSGDALLMNGPWPSLLLTYYEPPEGLPIYAVPQAAPPGFDEAVDVPRLASILQNHGRLWVSYGAIHWADPEYSVSRWLAENAYCVYERDGIALYLPPSERRIEALGPLDLGSLQLQSITVDREKAHIGDGVQLDLDLAGQHLDRSYGITLGLLDNEGDPWQQRDFRLGPVHQPTGSVLPNEWREQRGLWLLPGIPPGAYTLAFRIYGEGVDAGTAATFHGWVPIAPLEVLPSAPQSSLLEMLPAHADESLSFGGALAVAGLQPLTAKIMQGYATGFSIWWEAQQAQPASQVSIRMVGPTTYEAGTYALGPDFYPASAWQAGDVIQQQVMYQLPSDLPAGTYRVQAEILGDDGDPLPVNGTSVQNGEAASATSGSSNWTDLFSLKVEARKHRTHPPLLRTRQRVQFSDELLLRGYRLGRRRLHAGDETQLTVYWQALKAPNQVYAAFNHLRSPEGATTWQEDSWPQAGIYTTDRWQPGEVVAESYTIKLPSDLAPGTYTLYTGVYDPFTGNRLPAVTQSGERLVNDELALLELKVLP